MSYPELIAHLQLTANKVDKVIVYNRQGKPIAVTENTETNQSEGQSLMKCLQDCSKTLSKLSIDNEIFIFMQGVERTLIGKSVRDKERIAVACDDQGDMVVLIGQPSPNCSFIAELLKSLALRDRGQLINLQQQQLLVDGVVDIHSPSPSIRSEHILVDIDQGVAT
nr:hypothetical protein BgiMline_017175 [Biomphalaria glabrata]